MKTVKEFLRLVTQELPSPRTCQHHTITLDGDVLVFTLMQGNTYVRFNIHDEDLEKDPVALVDEIKQLIKDCPEPIDPKSPDLTVA